MVTKTSAGIAALALAALTTAGCGSDTSKSAGDAASSAASKASSAASSAASQAGGAVSSAASSASSAASSALAQVKGGIDATADVSAGTATTTSGGKATVQLKVTNPTSDAHDYTISVSFDDASGNLLDATVVNVSQVPANGSMDATATSNRDLSGTVVAKITAALRH